MGGWVENVNERVIKLTARFVNLAQVQITPPPVVKAYPGAPPPFAKRLGSLLAKKKKS